MDKYSRTKWSVNEITYPFPNFNGAAVEVWPWISNLTPHFIIDMITDPRWDKKLIRVSKRELVISNRYSFTHTIQGNLTGTGENLWSIILCISF